MIQAWQNLANVVVYCDALKLFALEILNADLGHAFPLAVYSNEIFKTVKFCDYKVVNFHGQQVRPFLGTVFLGLDSVVFVF